MQPLKFIKFVRFMPNITNLLAIHMEKNQVKGKNICVGSVDLGGAAILAPMSGITDMPFRKIAHMAGAGAMVSEMVACRQTLQNATERHRRMSKVPGAKPHIVQIVGHDPKLMVETAHLAVTQGADIIDINFGCPARKVTGQYCGVALMRDTPQATAIIQALTTSLKVPVTLKMRLGWDQENRNAPALAEIAQDNGIAMVTVHARTGKQKYTGKADWAFLKPIRAMLSIPLIVNGDITDLNSVNMAMRLSGADGVMVGRAALGRPWFIQQVIAYLQNRQYHAAPSLDWRLDLIGQHYRLILDHYGRARGVRIARKHLSWYLQHLPSSCTSESSEGLTQKWRKDVLTASDPDVVQMLLAKCCLPNAA